MLWFAWFVKSREIKWPLGSKDGIAISVSDVMLDIVADTAYDMVEMIDNSNETETII